MIATKDTGAYAFLIANLVSEEDDNEEWAGEVPDGFTYLGSGSYRHAFRGPDGLVYKRLTTYGEDNAPEDNQDEYKAYKRGTCPKGMRLAHMVLILNVSVMEYVPNAITWAEWLELEDGEEKGWVESGIVDISPQNVRKDDEGNYVVIDYAY